MTKKTRFEVFKRDGFQCIYCGRRPPAVILEIDHVDPKANGGGDDINNLVTSCFDCNRGKRDIPLDKIPPTLSENLEFLKEQESQLKEYRKFCGQIKRRKTLELKKIGKIYSDQYEGWGFSDSFKRSVLMFIDKIGVFEVEAAMNIAINRFPSDEDKVLKYFCGVCWQKIRSAEDLPARRG